MLSGKYYNGVAFVISTSVTRGEIIKGLSGLFKNDNSRFDINRFEKACELK